MSNVFLSYAKEDAPHARKVHDALTKQGIHVWFDEISLLPGQKWKSEIEKAISDSKYFIALLSNNSVSKVGYVQKELKIALDVLELHPTNQIYVIPVRVEECKIEDPKLKEIHYVDFFPDFDFGFSKLLKAIDHTSPSEAAPEPRPVFKDSDALPAQVDSAKLFFDDIDKKRTELQRREEERAAAHQKKQQQLEAILQPIELRASELVAAYNIAASARTLKLQVADLPISQASHRILLSFGNERHWLIRLVTYPNGMPAIQLVKVYGPTEQPISGKFTLTNDSINAVLENNSFWLSLNSAISTDIANDVVANTSRSKQPLSNLTDAFGSMLRRAIEFELLRAKVE